MVRQFDRALSEVTGKSGGEISSLAQVFCINYEENPRKKLNARNNLDLSENGGN